MQSRNRSRHHYIEITEFFLLPYLVTRDWKERTVFENINVSASVGRILITGYICWTSSRTAYVMQKIREARKSRRGFRIAFECIYIFIYIYSYVRKQTRSRGYYAHMHVPSCVCRCRNRSCALFVVGESARRAGRRAWVLGGGGAKERAAAYGSTLCF